MDFVEMLPVEICDIIFGFFRGNDLLEFSLVNQSWNSLIGSSSECMKKLVLAMRGDWKDFTDDDKKMLMNGRRYQNVLISDGTEHFNFIKDVMREQRRWKSVKICDFLAETNDDIINLFKMFEATVEDLEIYSLKMKDPRPFETCLNFKELKSLKMKFCEPNISGVFSQSTLKSVNYEVNIEVDFADNSSPEIELYDAIDYSEIWD